NGILVNRGGGVQILHNVIGNNSGDGVRLNASFNTVQDNFIGAADDLSPLPNNQNGVYINSSFNHVTANALAFNGHTGVAVNDGVGNSIRANSIFCNEMAGIDLGYDDPTPNDSVGHDG